MGKVPTYTKNAIDRYRAKHYFMQVRFNKDIKTRLDAVGLTASAVSDLVLKELEKRENAVKA